MSDFAMGRVSRLVGKVEVQRKERFMDTAAYRFDEGNLYEGDAPLSCAGRAGASGSSGASRVAPQSLRAGRLGAAAGRGESVGS